MVDVPFGTKSAMLISSQCKKRAKECLSVEVGPKTTKFQDTREVKFAICEGDAISWREVPPTSPLPESEYTCVHRPIEVLIKSQSTYISHETSHRTISRLDLRDRENCPHNRLNSNTRRNDINDCL
jgi:hypothetical protein